MQPDSGSTPANDGRYIEIAKAAVGRASRTREGFGALPENHGAFGDTYHLIQRSSLITGDLHDHEHPFCDCHRYRDPVGLFELFLADPKHFAPTPIWALFWSLAQAEHEFLTDFIPYWSHEERLTGHLVSKMLDRCRTFQDHWRDLDRPGRDGGHPNSWFQMKYIDTATARQEKLTGADLGLIVHARLHGHREFFKAVRFQAKKANPSQVMIDLDQVEALLRHKKLGYFLFYYPYLPRGFSFTPSVASAHEYEKLASEARKTQRGSLGAVSAEPGNDRWDFASFVTFAIADIRSPHGAVARNAEDAACTVMGNSNQHLPRPSRLIVLTLGDPPSRPDWDGITREYGGGTVEIEEEPE